MQINHSVQALKRDYRHVTGFQPMSGKPNPFHPQPDRFESQGVNLRFQGQLSQNRYFKSLLAMIVGLGSVLSPLGTRVTRAHGDDSHDEIPPPREQMMRMIEPERVSQPIQPDVKRYEHIEGLYGTLKTQPKGSWERSQTAQRIQNSWNSLANDARSGNDAAKMSLQALWVNRMYEELTEPSEYLVRTDYPEYSELLTSMNSGEITRDEFNTELQWRALLGLYCYYRNGMQDNPLVQNADRFYAPVTKLLAENPHPKIQSWGGNLMNNIFPQLNSIEQQNYLKTVGARFFEAPAGPQKLSAMKALNWLNADSPNNIFWSAFTGDIKIKLKSLLEDPKQTRNEDIKYYVTTLGMLRESSSSELIRKVATSPEYSPEAQGAGAWALGRLKTPENFAAANALIQNQQAPPLVREFAIYSLAEYSKQYELQVWDTLNAFKSDKAQSEPQAIKDAARAMRDMLSDRYLTEPDFYINKLLKTRPRKPNSAACAISTSRVSTN